MRDDVEAVLAGGARSSRGRVAKRTPRGWRRPATPSDLPAAAARSARPGCAGSSTGIPQRGHVRPVRARAISCPRTRELRRLRCDQRGQLVIRGTNTLPHNKIIPLGHSRPETTAGRSSRTRPRRASSGGRPSLVISISVFGTPVLTSAISLAVGDPGRRGVASRAIVGRGADPAHRSRFAPARTRIGHNTQRRDRPDLSHGTLIHGRLGVSLHGDNCR